MPDEGWWVGICRGKRGIFPKAYIELITAIKEDFGNCGTALYDYEAGYCYSLFVSYDIFIAVSQVKLQGGPENI